MLRVREFARIRLTFRNPIHAVRVYTFFHAIQSSRWIKNKEDCLHRCQRLKTFFTYRKWKRLSTSHFGIFGSEDKGRPITRTSPEENIFFSLHCSLRHSQSSLLYKPLTLLLTVTDVPHVSAHAPLCFCCSRLGKWVGKGNCELWNWIMSSGIHWAPYCLSDARENIGKGEF